MNQRRVPRKARHRERPDCGTRLAEAVPQQDDPNGYSAPSHNGGQFDDAGYGSGHGTFGFTHDTTP